MESVDDVYHPLPPSGGNENKEFHLVDFINSFIVSNDSKVESNQLIEVYDMTTHLDIKRKIRSKRGRLSLKERRELGLYKMRKNNIKYEDFIPLHNLWKEYFFDYIELPTLGKRGFRDKYVEQLSRLLLKADYHGAILTVEQSLCPSLVGKKGIVVMDSKNTFQLIGSDDVLRTIPKQSSVFTLTVTRFKFTIFGNQFCIKSAARNNKKVKTCINLEL